MRDTNTILLTKRRYVKPCSQKNGAARTQYGKLNELGRDTDSKRIAQMSAQTEYESGQIVLQSICSLGLVGRPSIPLVDLVVQDLGPMVAFPHAGYVVAMLDGGRRFLRTLEVTFGYDFNRRILHISHVK